MHYAPRTSKQGGNCMRNVLIGCAVLVALLVLIVVFPLWGSYNRMVTIDEKINSAWAQVENQLKRRSDLIPNLVETVKGYAKHEKEIFEEVARARAKLGGARTVEDKINASNELGGALSRLLFIAERYPDLKANEQFTGLRYELAGTENRIATERRRYNEAVREYNQYLRRFPGRFYAAIFGFKERPYFQATEEEKKLPQVKF